MLSIIERQKQAASLALQEGSILSRRHYILTGMILSDAKKAPPLLFNKKRQPAISRKFSAEQAAAIRATYEAGDRSYRQLARDWNCGLRCINQVVRRWGAYKVD